MDFPNLETNRLKLVEINSSHENEIFQIFSNEDVMKYYGMNPFTERAQAAQMIESFQSRYENKLGMRWGIIEKASNQLIGTIGLNNLLISGKRTEIGYDLLPNYWNKGYIKEAIKEVITYCFETLNLYRIGANIFPDNIASSKAVMKLGFKKEGLLRGYIYQENESHDVNVYSLIRPEWNKDL